MKIKLSVISLVLLTACQGYTFPMRGNINGAEKVIGSWKWQPGQIGQMNFSSDEGSTCLGPLEFNDDRVTGKGTFKCSDGRTGNYQFTWNEYKGKGFGKLNNGQKFEFTYGNAAIAAEPN